MPTLSAVDRFEIEGAHRRGANRENLVNFEHLGQNDLAVSNMFEIDDLWPQITDLTSPVIEQQAFGEVVGCI
jgi:hypothetical protein